MEKIDTIYKIGNIVKIIINDYDSYYGFSSSVLIITNIKINESDNLHFDNRVILEVKTIEGDLIPIWIFEENVDFIT